MKMPLDRVCIKTIGAAIAAALSLALPGGAAAADRLPVPPQQAETCPFLIFCVQSPLSPVERWRLYRESGTFGRQGLGASPFHPEGPGNRSF